MSKHITTFDKGDNEVRLYQDTDASFTVIYGLQCTTRLSYADACKEFGVCVFHSLTCAGKLDNEGGDE